MRTRIRALRSDALDGLEQWVPAGPEELLALVDALVERTDCSRATAAGLVEWVTRRVVGRDDRTSDPTRARYRRLLRELEASGYHPRDASPMPGYLRFRRAAA